MEQVNHQHLAVPAVVLHLLVHLAQVLLQLKLHQVL
jgi:hypothetical protein